MKKKKKVTFDLTHKTPPSIIVITKQIILLYRVDKQCINKSTIFFSYYLLNFILIHIFINKPPYGYLKKIKINTMTQVMFLCFPLYVRQYSHCLCYNLCNKTLQQVGTVDNINYSTSNHY